MSNIQSTMKDADMPLLDRIEAALDRITNRQGLMRIPREATDIDVVVLDCGDEIKRLRAELIVTKARVDAMQRCIDERTAQRDEARREACRNDVYCGHGVYTAKELADGRGWDCFDEKEARQ